MSSTTSHTPILASSQPFSGLALTVISANIEGFSSAKSNIIAEVCKQHQCNVLCLQETHRSSRHNRPVVPGMDLIAEIPHEKHGSAIYVRSGSSVISTTTNNNNGIECLSAHLEGITITSVYKPPGVPFVPAGQMVQSGMPSQVFIGDFNSHSTAWGYNNTYVDGECVQKWAEANHLRLVHDPKLPASFYSGRWKRGYNPDLIFGSDTIAEGCVKTILDPVPHTQHRPLCLQIKAVVTPKTVPHLRRFNFKKANWKSFSSDLDSYVSELDASAEQYPDFIQAVFKSSKRNIPRGCRTNYIPGLSPSSADLYEDYKERFENDPFAPATAEAGEIVMAAISKEKRKMWQEMIESTDLTHSSRKAWNTIKRLSVDNTKAEYHSNVTANQIAHQLLLNGKSNATMPKQSKPRLKRPNEENNPGLTNPFTSQELENGIKALKQGKTAGLDNIRAEQITQFGSTTRKWLLRFYNNCLRNHRLPKLWRKAKVIALLKPGKDPNDPKSFRPISLLSHLYKLFERLLLNRLQPLIEDHIISEQAGFRPGKSCTGQLLNLTQHIENGFEEGLITGAVFVDLSAAYDTVNHRLLLSKILNTTKDFRFTELMQSLLSNRRYFVSFCGKSSRWRRQKNGLPQGSVLAPILYNIYTNDQPVYAGTRSFLYADDLCITTQHKDFRSTEKTLSEALDGLTTYYSNNHLRANPTKTQVCAFHLRTRDAKRKLDISWNGTKLSHCNNPSYLGVKLDRSLTYRAHVEKLRAKVAARNNILRKLGNSKWGAHPETIRSTALALCYSTAEYASPVWSRSAHAKNINPMLNESCRCITGCLKPTNANSLHILSGISPPDIRRDVASRKERTVQVADPRHPLHNQHPACSRLKSRKSFLATTEPLDLDAASTRLQLWQERLATEPTDISMELSPVEKLPPGTDAPWKNWRCLNRLRTGTGRCGVSMQFWGYTNDPPICDCGHPQQTMKHLLECPSLESRCTAQDLAEFNKRARACVMRWASVV